MGKNLLPAATGLRTVRVELLFWELRSVRIANREPGAFDHVFSDT